MTRRKNVKRIDPRYFLHETVDRDINTGEALEEERQAPVTHWMAGPGGLVDQHGDVFVKHGTPFAATRKPGQPGMMVIGVNHGTGTERWFSERPVPYEDVQKHSSNSNYNPPRPGPEHRPRSGWNETVLREGDDVPGLGNIEDIKDMAQALLKVPAVMDFVEEQAANPEIQAIARQAAEGGQINELGPQSQDLESGAKVAMAGSIALGGAGIVSAIEQNAYAARGLLPDVAALVHQSTEAMVRLGLSGGVALGALALILLMASQVNSSR